MQQFVPSSGPAPKLASFVDHLVVYAIKAVGPNDLTPMQRRQQRLGQPGYGQAQTPTDPMEQRLQPQSRGQAAADPMEERVRQVFGGADPFGGPGADQSQTQLKPAASERFASDAFASNSKGETMPG